MIGIYGWQISWQILGIIVWTIALAPVFLLIAETPESIGLLPDGLDQVSAEETKLTEDEQYNTEET